jgi:hypothetical protein
VAALVPRFHATQMRLDDERSAAVPTSISNELPSWVGDLVPCSEIAELLIAPNDGSGRPYVFYALGNGAKLLTPKQGAARRAGFTIYNPQMLTGLAAKCMMSLGLWPGQTIGVRTERLDELRETLASRTGNPDIELAFQFGATGIYSKTVVLVMDSVGNALAYAKLAAGAAAQEAVRHEAAVLDQLSANADLRGRVPCSLGDLEWRGYSLLVMSPGPVRRAPLAFGAVHRSFLACLRQATRTPAIFTESPMWHEMIKLHAAWSSRLSSTWCERYDWALGELERRLGETRLDLALAHRDFAPWNTRLNSDGSVFVFDWEFAKAGSTPGWDFFNFHIAMGAARARPLDADSVAELLAAARREGIAPAEDLLLACLTDMALFQHDAMLREGAGKEENHRLLGSAGQGIDTLRRLRLRR